jgi:hypothetical protein
LGHILVIIHSKNHQAPAEILDPRVFINRWHRALPPNAKHFAKKVNYYRREDVPGNVWPQPELIATTKLAQFVYQQEYRFGFSTTGALDFGQCTQQLVDRKARPLPKRDEHHTMTLDLGDLHDICKLLGYITTQGLFEKALGAAKRNRYDNIWNLRRRINPMTPMSVVPNNITEPGSGTGFSSPNRP